MHILTRCALGMLIALSLAAGSAVAATGGDFYLNLLRRGVADFNAGRLDPAVQELQIAAFGLLDSIEHFQTAQVYLAIAHDRLGREADARRAAQRVLAAERVQQRFASLSLPGDVRSGFAGVSRKLLTTEEQVALGLANPLQAVPPPQVAATTTPTPQSTTPQVQTTTPAPVTPQSSGPTLSPVTPPQPSTERNTTTTPPPPSSTMTTPPTESKPLPSVTPATRIDVAERFRAADTALAASDLPAARAAYRDILTVTNLDHATLVRVAEGTYRARDFRSTIAAFERAGPLRREEEPYRYYLAVALYETGEYERARRELRAVLPLIEITPDVERYRVKIEAAID